MTAYTDFVECLQKYSESCNTASIKCRFSLLITEHCRGYNDDYVSQHASNKVQMTQQFHIQHSHRHMHMNAMKDFVVYKA